MKEILPEDIWNDEKREGIKDFIRKHYKIYTEEDLRAAWEDGYQYSVHRSAGIKNEKYEEFIENFKKDKDGLE